MATRSPQPPMQTLRVSRQPAWWGTANANLFWAEVDDEWDETWKIWEPANAEEVKAAQRFWEAGQSAEWDDGSYVKLQVPEGANIRIGKPDIARAEVPSSETAVEDPLLAALRRHAGNLVRALESVEGQASFDAKGLTSVSLRYTQITDVGMSALAEQTGITDLTMAPGMTDAALASVANMKSLRRLGLEKMRFQGDGLKYLSAMIDLQSLSLFESEIGEGALNHLPRLPGLIQLNLNMTRVPDSALEPLARISSLKDLSLGQSQVTGSGLRFLQKLRKLEELSLYQSAMTGLGLSELKGFPALKQLDLSLTQVDDAGMDYLSRLQSLEIVLLERTQITDAAIPALARCPSLKFVNANETAVTFDGVLRLKQLRPDCEITAVNAERLRATKVEKAELLTRYESRRPRPVAESWRRIETWLKDHAPQIFATLRPGASEEELRRIEQTIGQSLPDDVRESYRIHDGQNRWIDDDDYVPGVFFGLCPRPLHYDEGVEWCWLHRTARNPEDFDESNPEVRERFQSFPKGAIRLAWMRAGWVPLYWDSGRSFLGVDLDPAPEGTVGQVIPFGWDFGVGSAQKYVLAPSWAHFLEDVADELEAGHGEVAPREAVGDDWFTLRGYGHFWNAIPDWSRAKLPNVSHP
ncbi:MAG: SMI1/KNR4 family protein [Planctomycetes bacterium]|nr:SMI1/KNR4 family protein [Planctomycetota bacterium]